MLYWLMCVVLSFKFELSESILKQLLIKHLFYTFLLLFRFKSNMVVQ